MPNWCSNKLVITGPKESISALKATFKDGVFNLNQTVPMLEILKDVCSGMCSIDGVEYCTWKKVNNKDVPFTKEETAEFKKIGYNSLYDWAIANWGTKWDVGDSDSDHIGVTPTVTDEEISMYFDTAWAPPCKWAETVSSLFPELTFTLYFSECGSGFYGTFSAHNGETEDETKHDFYEVSTESTEDEDDGCDEDDMYAGLSDDCRDFLEYHGLGLGG